jgi:hypothetical protein
MTTTTTNTQQEQKQQAKDFTALQSDMQEQFGLSTSHWLLLHDDPHQQSPQLLADATDAAAKPKRHQHRSKTPDSGGTTSRSSGAFYWHDELHERVEHPAAICEGCDGIVPVEDTLCPTCGAHRSDKNLAIRELQLKANRKQPSR